MQGSIILTETLKELRLDTRRIIHQGGQSAGKTVNILGALATLCAEEESNGDVTTITSMSMPHLKGGALRDFEMYVYPSFGGSIRKYNKTDHLFTFKSGSVMEFKTFENELKARGPRRKRLYVNEANTFPSMTWFQLDSRSKQSVIDYNPSIRFWAHEDLIGEPGNKLFISDHRHNPFLTQAQHDFTENICKFAYDDFGNIIKNDRGEPLVVKGDYELFKVYARGLTGNITGIIFPDWEMIDDSYFPTDAKWIYSVDFGYTIDPTAVVMQCVIGETIFIRVLAYEPGLPAKSIVQTLRANGFSNDDILICEHDPDQIRDIRNHGIYANFARKGPGSVKSGIKALKQYKVKYSHLSRNLKDELSKYVWETEKETGKIVNTPVDRNNHAIDAIRYGAYTTYLTNIT